MAVLGTVIALTGVVYVIYPNGQKKQLQLGDTVEAGDVIQTGDCASVELMTCDGRVVDIPANQVVAANDDLARFATAEAGDNAVGLSTVQSVVQSINTGKDVTQVLNATPPGEVSNDYGFSFVDLARTAIVPLLGAAYAYKSSISGVDVQEQAGIVGGANGFLTAVGGGGGPAVFSDGNESVTTAEDTAANGNVLANFANATGPVSLVSATVDKDGNGTQDAIVFGVATPINSAAGNLIGTLTLNANGTYTFTPAPDYNGPVPAVSYTATDGTRTDTSALNINVTPVVDTVNDTLATATDTPKVFNPILGTNGASADNFEGATPQITAINGTAITVGGPAVAVPNGSVTLGAGNVLTFTPAPGFNGTVPTFTYTVTSGGVTETGNINISVGLVDANETKTVAEDSPTITENLLTGTVSPSGGPLSILSANVDTDGNGTQDALVLGVATPITNASGALIGSITVNAAGTYTFTPGPDYNGPVPVINYIVTDGTSTNPSTLTLNITAVKDTVDDVVTTPQGVAIIFNPITGTNGASADNFEGATPQITAINGTPIVPGGAAVPVANGTISMSAVGNNLTFTPNPGFAGTTPPITYTVLSGGVTETGNIKVIVGIADANETATTLEDTTSTGNLLVGTSSTNGPVTLTNATVDKDGNGTQDVITLGTPTAITNASGVAIGTLTITAAGTYTFVPAPDYNGAVPVVNYTVSDGTTTDTSTLTINVTPVADTVNDTLSTGFNTSKIFNPITGTNGASADNFEGATPQITQINGTPIAVGGSVNVPNGTVTLGANNQLTFTPTNGFSGAVPQFTYTVLSGGVTETGNINITVTGPLADANETATTNEDTTVSGGLLAGTVSPTGGPLSIAAATVDKNGDGIQDVITLGSPTAITNASGVAIGTLTITAAGTYTFVPAPDYNGAVPVVNYTVSDGTTTDTSTLTINVTPVADTVNDTLSTGFNTSKIFNPITGTNGASADNFEGATPQITQINGTPITVGGSVNVPNGTVTLGANNQLTFTPTNGFSGAVPQFTYTVLSGGVTETGNINITVTGPLADANETATTNEDTTVSGGLLAGTVSPTGGPLSITAATVDKNGDGIQDTITLGTPTAITNASGVAIGTLTITAAGTYTFVPAPDYNGAVPVVNYTVSDGTTTDTSTLTINVTPVADTVNDILTTTQGVAITYNPITGNNGASADNFEGATPQITAINGTPIAVGGSVNVPNGTVTLGANNQLTFTPLAGFSGVVNGISYTVSSGGVTENGSMDFVVTPAPTVLSVGNGQATEGSNISHLVTLSAATTSVISVPFNLTNGSATLGVDTATPVTFTNGVTYDSISGSLIIQPA